jgi:hypothetical protein
MEKNTISRNKPIGIKIADFLKQVSPVKIKRIFYQQMILSQLDMHIKNL